MRNLVLSACCVQSFSSSRSRATRLLPWVVLGLVLGCEQDAGDQAGLGSLGSGALPECVAPSPAQLRSFEGIYSRTLHSRNPDACESDGTPLPASLDEPLLLVVSTDFFGAPVAAVRTCRDLADCRRAAAEIRESAREPSLVPLDPPAPSPEYGALFECQTDAASGLRGGGASVGNFGAAPDVCQLSHSDTLLQRTDDGGLRIERRTRAWTTPARDGECVYDAEQIPADAACSEREVYAAQLLSEL